MTETTRQKAQSALAMVEEVTAVILPEPAPENAIVPLAEADAPLSAEITRRMNEIEIDDTNSIVSFGSSAQAELQQISQAMLGGVRNKDVGPAGDSLRNIVTTIRGFSVSELDVRRKRSWWERLIGRSAPFANFVAKFETVQGQIDKITDTLLIHEHTLLKDVKSLDILYEKTLTFYDELALYIAAGEAKLAEVDAKDIPAKEAAVAAAPEADQVKLAQELRDLRAAGVEPMALLSLMAYGCFHGGGLSDLLDGWLGASNQVFVDPFPILKTLKTSTLIALGVLAVIASLGADTERAAADMASLSALAGRGAREKIEGPRGAFELIDESYNANPMSMAAAIATSGAMRIVAAWPRDPRRATPCPHAVFIKNVAMSPRNFSRIARCSSTGAPSAWPSRSRGSTKMSRRPRGPRCSYLSMRIGCMRFTISSRSWSTVDLR